MTCCACASASLRPRWTRLFTTSGDRRQISYAAHIKCRAEPGRHNPQNTDNPLIVPSQHLSASEAVAAQLDALQDNNEPWPNHGILTMYEFAEDVGGLDRSVYFGKPKDLYHFDHFMGHFGNSFRDLIGASGYELTAPVEAGPKQCTFVADVQGTNGVTAVRFEMVVKAIGGKKGCWMTRSLLRV